MGLLTRIAPRDQNDPAKVARRNGIKYSGPTMTLNMFLRDDSDEMFVQINRSDYETMATPILAKAKAGKSLYAFKGHVPFGFRMLKVTEAHYIGEFLWTVA